MKRAFLISLIASCFLILTLIYDIYFRNEWQFSFLILNICLAWIPFFLSFFIPNIRKLKLGAPLKLCLLITISFLWFIFYPNIPYILTDIIHIQSRAYLKLENDIFVYNENIILWYELVQVVFTIFLSIIIGFISLFNIQKMIEQKSKILSWISVLITSLFAGVGTYFGRFLRLNSWQIFELSDQKNLSFLFAHLSNFIEFTLLFGILWFSIYIVMYLSMKR